MSEYPCTLCNNFVAFTLEVLNQHQKTDQCLKAVLERMNDEQETGSTPMDIDDSDVNLGGVDVDASGDEPMDIVAPSTTGSIVMFIKLPLCLDSRHLQTIYVVIQKITF